MQSKALRVGVVVALVAVAVVLFIVLRDDDEPSQGSRPTGTAGPDAEQTGHSVQTITVRGGKPEGGVAKLEYTTGDEVRLRVRSGVADEVHVHGYDLLEEVGPGSPAQLEFNADIEGVFEVELESAHIQLAELRVTPG